MIKKLPSGSIKIDQLSSDIKSIPNIVLYYVSFWFCFFVALYYSMAIDPFGPGNIQKDIPAYLPVILSAFTSLIGIFIHYFLSFKVFELFGAKAIYRSRVISHRVYRFQAPFSLGVFRISQKLIPIWLSSVWMPQRAFPKRQYLFIVIFPFAGTLFILYALEYFFCMFVSMGLGVYLFFPILLEIFFHFSQLFLFFRLLISPSSTYFVDRQNGLYIYHQSIKNVESTWDGLTREQ
jgi:hypothetical protein